jgi:hypothetical protein
MAKIGEGFDRYLHNVLDLEAVATRYHAEAAEHDTCVRESRGVGDALNKRFSSVFGVPASQGESWFTEGNDADDAEAEIGKCRRNVARALNVAEEILSLERTIRSATSNLSRGFEMGQAWTTLAENTLAKGDAGDAVECSCDEVLARLDGYKDTLAEVVQLQPDLMSVHHRFASAEQRVSVLADSIGAMVSRRPYRLPEMEAWAAAAATMLVERASVEGTTEAMERYRERLSTAVEQRSQIVADFLISLEKRRSAVANFRKEMEVWKAEIDVAKRSKRKVPIAEAIWQGVVIAGVLGGVWRAIGTANLGAFIEGATLGAFLGGPVLALFFRLLGLRPLGFLHRDIVDRSARAAVKGWERGKHDLAQAEALLQDLISQDPSDPAWDSQVARR